MDAGAGPHRETDRASTPGSDPENSNSSSQTTIADPAERNNQTGDAVPDEKHDAQPDHKFNPEHRKLGGCSCYKKNSRERQQPPVNQYDEKPALPAREDLEQNRGPILPIAEPQRFTSPSSPGGRYDRFLKYAAVPISPDSPYTSFLLLVCCLATGVNDAATFMDYHLFVSNQTGNTVFLGVGAIDNNSIYVDEAHVAFAVAGFAIGGFIAGRVHTIIPNKRARWWVVLSCAIQTIFVLIAAGLRQWYAKGRSDTFFKHDDKSFAVIWFLAFQAGLQVACARGLGVAEIPTGMITSAWIDLVIDPDCYKFWGKRNKPRDRRLFFILMILCGSFIGAATHRYTSPATPMLIAGIIKFFITIGFAFGRGAVKNQPKKNEPIADGTSNRPGHLEAARFAA